MSLPSGYKRLEYIQSTGTQYVNSNFVPNQNTRVVMNCKATSLSSGGSFPFGTRESFTKNAFDVALTTSQTFHNYGTKYQFANFSYVLERMTIDANKNVCTFSAQSDSVSITLDTATFTAPTALIVGSAYDSGTIFTGESAWNGYIYSCQIYDNGTLIRDYIPCQTTSGEVGLWDDVNEVFYGNAGTGTFTAGPVFGQYGNDENTLLLLHGDDLKDSSPCGVTLTNSGVTVSNVKSKFGANSLLFNRGNYLTIPAIDFGSNDFTVDWWEYVSDDTAGTRFSTVFASSYQTGSGGILAGCYEGFSKIYVSSKTSFQWDLISGQKCFNNNAMNAWIHRAIVRDRSSLKIFTNGTLERTYDIGTSAIGYNANSPFCIGKWVSDYDQSGYSFCGYIDEFRISNIARWAADFTPPTEPYSSPILPTPSNFRLSSSSETTATLAWSAVDGATGYKLYKNGALLATLTDTSYTDTVQVFSSTVYAVTAYNDDGESTAAELTYCSIPENPILYLVTDRTESDVAYVKLLSEKGLDGMSDAEKAEWLSGLKGAYTASDLNRVESAVDYVAGRLQSFGNAVEVYTKKDWATNDVPTVSPMKRYLNDVAALRAVLAVLPTTPEVPPDMDGLTYTEANDIEQILTDIDRLITNMTFSWMYSGDIYSGEV